MNVELYQADRKTRIGPLVNNLIIDLAKTPSLSIKASTTTFFQFLFVSSVQFSVDAKLLSTDNRRQFWSSEWKPTVGKYKIDVQAYRFNNGNGRAALSNTVTVTVVNSNTRAPAIAPRAAPVQPAAPVVVPAPATTPASPGAAAPSAPVAPPSAPVAPKAPAAPAAAPTGPGPVAAAPAAAPTVPGPVAPAPSVPAPAAPTVQPPVAAPAAPSVPVRPPVAPSVPVQPPLAPAAPVPPPKAPAAPTKAPVSAPTPCVSDIVSYINNITLSKQTLSTTGVTPLDKALKELNESNSRVGVQLSTCVEADKERLRQRFAYYALIYSAAGNPAWFNNSNECAWNGIQCSNNSRFSSFALAESGFSGTIPADVGLWVDLTAFNVRENAGLNGTLPMSIGAWTNLQFFRVDKCTLEDHCHLPLEIGATSPTLRSTRTSSLVLCRLKCPSGQPSRMHTLMITRSMVPCHPLAAAFVQKTQRLGNCGRIASLQVRILPVCVATHAAMRVVATVSPSS
jgi:hypothetical protein